MSRFVLDASVGLAWFLDHSMPPLARRARRALLEGTRALVPTLWHLEMANGLVMAERRGLLGATEVAAFAEEVERLCSEAIQTSPDVYSVRHILGASRSSRLSTYDAAYLELARAEALPVATLDGELRRAAAEANVELFR